MKFKELYRILGTHSYIRACIQEDLIPRIDYTIGHTRNYIPIYHWSLSNEAHQNMYYFGEKSYLYRNNKRTYFCKVPKSIILLHWSSRENHIVYSIKPYKRKYKT